MKVNDDVLRVLDSARVEGNTLRLVSQLDRKLYERTNKVLVAAGGKWNRKLKAHLFDGEAADAMEQVILTGEISTHKDFDFFPTPAPVVARLIQLADVQPGMRVLEPSAGTGNIADELAKMGEVDCIELRPEYAAKIGGGARNGTKVTVGDFLALPPNAIYERVVMNPPFKSQSDIRHVLHALKFLASGGRLVSVMSAGVTFRENGLTRAFRTILDERGSYMEHNADDAFKSSGTMVRTVNVVIYN